MWKYVFLFLSILCVFYSLSKTFYDIVSDFATAFSSYLGKKVNPKFTNGWARTFWYVLTGLFICLTIYFW